MQFRVIALVVATAIGGCADDGVFESKEDAHYRGYGDGYAAGYNTTCEVRSTVIAADWNNSGYAEGYRRGYADGALQCKRDPPP